MPTYEAIQAQIEKLGEKARVLRQKEVKRILGEMKKLGITLEDLGGATLVKASSVKATRKPGSKAEAATSPGRKLNLAPKYVDPATGAMWTGHGRAPAWIRDAADRDVFLIGKKAVVKSKAKKTVAAEKAIAKKPASKLAGRKLNLAPKYSDPATGNTWTGHGKAPSWIRDAANRDDFLIAKAGKPKTQSAKSASAKKTAAKKPAVKKTAARKVAAPQEAVEATVEE
jgi:DNA-binding protein H-NS